MDTDVLLVRKTLDGETESFNILMNKYYHGIVSYLCKLGTSREDSEDLAQETFVKTYRNLSKYSEQWKFSTWLFQIAINIYRDNLRKRKGNKELSTGEIEKDTSNQITDQLDDICRREAINNAFEKLDIDVKEALILHYYQGFSMVEIGKIQSKSPAAIKMKIFRARKKMCHFLKQRGAVL